MAKRVELISSSLVSDTATAALMSRLELNPWDLRLLATIPIERGLIFHNLHFQSQQIHHLKTSLSRALDFFPPLAGRLATIRHDGDKASFFVDCNNAGAEFTHAVAASVAVSDLLGPSYTEIESSLFPINIGVHNYEGISKPLLAVQVTELEDGLFIGCAANHAVVDGASFWHFFNSWSEISRGSESISKSPIFDRFNASAAVDNTLIHIPTLEQNLIIAPSQLVPQKVFHFSKEKLGQLKAKANSEADTDKISTLQALMAHLWRSTVRSQTSNNDPITRALVILIGARARMSSLPDGYFGNAIGAAALSISEGELLQKGLGAAALRINEVISEQTEVISKQTDVAIARAEENNIVELGQTGVGAGSGPLLFISGSHRHDVYGCDFGWGKPIAVRSTKDRRFDGSVVVLPAAEGGGIDLEVCLKEETLRGMKEFLYVLHQ